MAVTNLTVNGDVKISPDDDKICIAWLDACQSTDAISAIADSVTATAALGAILAGLFQLSNSNKQKRVFTTLQACDRYDSDPVISEAVRVFYNYCEKRIRVVQEVELENATRTLFNFFEAIAIGIYQDLYDSKIVYEHLGKIMIVRREQLFNSNHPIHKKYVESFVDYFSEYNRVCDRFSRGKTRMKFLGVRLQGID